MTVMDNEIRGEQEEEQREAEDLGEPLPPDWEEPAREIDPEAAEEPEAQEAEPADQEAMKRTMKLRTKKLRTMKLRTKKPQPKLRKMKLPPARPRRERTPSRMG